MEEDGDEDSAASMEDFEGEEVSEAAQVDKAKAFAAVLKKSGLYLPANRAKQSWVEQHVDSSSLMSQKELLD